ncbi:MAG: molybdate ABC transporter substrate-binding protein [Deltaproteobacteria bacterium]|jgi:molybdate transport system substrate-binding protein|nr:molybdate ABC transporter substrate-binding protein [Deltaproteobacteria bacterium]
MKKLVLTLAFLLIFTPSLTWADEFQVAVASNFQAPSELIAAAFQKKTGHKAILAFGATGNFYAQIKNGSPVSIFLAADSKTPKKLEDEGMAKAGSRFTYAQGALVLWSATAGYVDDKGEVLKGGKYAHLAVANPEKAPYGAAAYEVLKNANLLAQLEKDKKLVTGENIGQTLQFVETGNAELGFLAKSQVWKDGKFKGGSGWLVAPNLYSPIMQDVVILKSAENNKAVEDFANFLRGKEAKEIILSFGYILPSK